MDAIDLAWERPGVLVLTGEVGSVAAKKRARAQAAAQPGVVEVIDRTLVVPEMPLDDTGIRDDLRDALLEDPLLRLCILRERTADGVVLLLAPQEPAADITFSVTDAVVTLRGQAAHVTLRRLAEVVAWWVPGVRDVANHIDPIELAEDEDLALAEAVVLAFARDPFVAQVPLLVSAAAGVVTLSGTVGSDDQRRLAEDDAWCVDGVVEVVNEVVVG